MGVSYTCKKKTNTQLFKVCSCKRNTISSIECPVFLHRPPLALILPLWRKDGGVKCLPLSIKNWQLTPITAGVKASLKKRLWKRPSLPNMFNMVSRLKEDLYVYMLTKKISKSGPEAQVDAFGFLRDSLNTWRSTWEGVP